MGTIGLPFEVHDDRAVHYPTESSLIWDGLRKIIQLSALVATALNLPEWRQHAHLLKYIKKLHCEIARAAASKNPRSKKKLKKLYEKLLKRAKDILDRAEKLVKTPLRPARS